MTTSIKTCFKCHQAKPLTEFYRHSAMADGHLNKCKDCARSDVARHRAENLERIREYDRSRGMLPHRVAAREAYSTTDAARKSRSKSGAKYRANNKEARRVIKAVCENSRRIGKISRTPPWLNDHDKMLIKARYSEARWMTIHSGIKHHVDHIVPLLGKSVCGLHVPWNLRVIPARENTSKGNKF